MAEVIKKTKKRVCIWLLLGALCALLASGFFAYQSLKVYPLLTEGEMVTFYVPDSGLTVEEVLLPLEESGRLKNPNVYHFILRMKGNPIALKGHYQISQETTVLEAIRILAQGYETPVWLRMNGYKNLEQIAEQISEEFGYSPGQTLAMLEEVGMAQIIPNSYQVYWSSSLDELQERLLQEFSVFWTSTRLEKAEELGLSPQEVVILSSIVQAETKEPTEWKRVASLYLARLEHGWPLEADPTAVYAYKLLHPEDKEVIRRVSTEITQLENPYNTYHVKGLPPGPLSTVETQIIDAVLDARPGNEFFMCADPDRPGFHVFAQSLREHNRNATRYHESLNRRGIRR